MDPVIRMYMCGIAMMAVRFARGDQSLTQRVDSAVQSLQLPDIGKSLKDQKMETFTAPPWSAVSVAKDAKSQGKVSSLRRGYYMTLMACIAMGTTMVGTAIIAATSFINKRKAYDQLPAGIESSPAQSQQHLQSKMRKALRTLRRKAPALVLFQGHLVVLSIFLFTAASEGQLSAGSGLTWELWTVLLTWASAWMVLQAILRALWACFRKETFGASSFAMAFMTYCMPLASDGFDTCKDIIFGATVQTFPQGWLHVLGKAAVLWLAALHTFLIFSDTETQDSVCRTFASVLFMNPEFRGNIKVKDEGHSIFAEDSEDHKQGVGDKLLISLFQQTTHHKRMLLLLEDGPQGVAAIIAVISQGNSIFKSLFMVVFNILVPAIKYVLALSFHEHLAKEVTAWSLTEIRVAFQAGNAARVLHLISNTDSVQRSQGRDELAKIAAWAVQQEDCELTHLNLQANAITDEGAKALATAIRSKECQLSSLALAGNRIKDEGAEALASAIASKECQLSSLGLAGNRIREEGAKALASAIASQDCELLELNLSRNGIGVAGTEALASVIMKKDCQLSSLNLSACNIGPEGADALTKSLGSQDCALKHLDLSACWLSPEIMERLRDAAKPSLKLILE